ncbi:MAG TPA: hypothetical protein ENF26_07270 [Methanomicrobia archaeon]|nr:hypothetical protein [Methanomicrobia archaeon]HEX59927.1 hypothetical protein [Methanomicrobia archaeon]
MKVLASHYSCSQGEPGVVTTERRLRRRSRSMSRRRKAEDAVRRAGGRTETNPAGRRRGEGRNM